MTNPVIKSPLYREYVTLIDGAGDEIAIGSAGGLSADIATIAAGENVIGKVGFPDIVVTVTPTVDTSAYTSGDLLFRSVEIPSAVRANGGTCILQSVVLLDKADQGVAMTLVFANANTPFGVPNSAPNPTDAGAATVLGHVAVATGDYVDLGGSKVAYITNLGVLMQADASATSLYVAGINSTGTPTYGAASDLVFKFGFLRS